MVDTHPLDRWRQYVWCFMVVVPGAAGLLELIVPWSVLPMGI